MGKKLVLVDEINCQFQGLTMKELAHVRNQTSLPVAGAFMQLSYKQGIWDGKEAIVDEEGITYQYMIDKVIDALEEYGSDLSSLEIVDERDQSIVPDGLEVGSDWLLDESGYNLRHYQKAAINLVVGSQNKGVVNAATSAGKAQPLWSKILTPSGWVTMGDIKVGDYVVGSDGKPKKVLGVYPQGIKPVYEVTTKRGTKTHCCKEHLWAVRTKSDASRGKPFKVKQLKDIMKDLSDTGGKGNKWQLPFLSSPIEMEKRDLPLHPYYLGVLLGDGCFGEYSLSFTNTEEDIIEKVELLKPKEDRIARSSSKDTCYNIVKHEGRGRKITVTMEAIRSMGLGHKGSHEKFIPKDYLYSCAEDRLALLHGLVDTDGYVTREHSIEYVSTSKQLAEDVAELIRSLGGVCNVSVKENPKYSYKGETRFGKTAYRVNARFSEGGVVPVSSKKHTLKYKPIKRRLSETIQTVEFYGQAECQCIMIDSDDHLYVTDDYILTHNTVMCLGISKALDPYTKSVVVVPDENLAKQTFKDYDKSDLSVLLMTPKIKPKDREKAIKDHRHIILTSKLFMNCIEYFKKEHFALLLDEVHKVCGDVMLDILRFDVPHWQIRIGLTGTVPKDKLKKTKIFCHLGGDIILKVSPRELQDEGHASTVSIKMIKCVHRELEDLFQEMYEMKDGNGNRGYDWSVEQDYLWSNKDRAAAIAEYINSLDKTNTLILCHPQFGQMLAPLVSEQGCINDEVHPDTRLEWLSGFDTKKDHYLVASFGTASTGLSYNHIYRVILIDVGKNFSYILQSIGRAMRLDGVHNHADVIDISSNMLYSNRHQKEREKIYKDEKFDYAIDNNYIMVG